MLCCAKSLQSCLTLFDPIDCSLPGSSVHGILQARILEWVAMPSSRGIFLTQGSNPHLFCLLHWQAGYLQLVPPGDPVSLPLSISSVCGASPTCEAQTVNKLLQYGRPGFDPWVREIPLEEGMATHSSIPAWRISWTKEPGGL